MFNAIIVGFIVGFVYTMYKKLNTIDKAVDNYVTVCEIANKGSIDYSEFKKLGVSL